MEGLVVTSISCLVILLQFHGILCDERHMVDREGDNNERLRRYHESDCPKERVKNDQKKIVKNPKIIEQKPKIAPKPVFKEKLPINERNEPKNVTIINHILEEIANLAHNHNEPRGIQKIRHLVDEIDNQNKNKLKFDKTHNTKKDQAVKETDIIVLKPRNPTKVKDSVKALPHESSAVIKQVPAKEFTNPIKNEDTSEITKPLFTSELSQHADENSSNNYDFNKLDVNDENLIEIKEHKYEEEMLHSSSYKNKQAVTYLNWYMGQNCNPGYYYRFDPYDYKENPNDIETYYVNNLSYPTATYPDNGNVSKDYYTNFNENSVQAYEGNEYCMTHKKTWLDRDTVIAKRDPDKYHVKTIIEDRKDVTNEQSPDFYRNLY